MLSPDYSPDYQEGEEKIFDRREDGKVHYERTHPGLYGALSRPQLTQLSQHSTHVGQMAGHIAASAFHRLSQYASSPTVTQNSPFLP